MSFAGLDRISPRSMARSKTDRIAESVLLKRLPLMVPGSFFHPCPAGRLACRYSAAHLRQSSCVIDVTRNSASPGQLRSNATTHCDQYSLVLGLVAVECFMRSR